MLFDNVFSNHPSFLLMVVAAYAMCARGPLMQCVELDDFKVRTSYTVDSHYLCFPYFK